MLAAALGLALAGCAAATPSPRSAPLWNDPDRHVFRGPPSQYYSGKYTDGIDQTVLRPLTRIFAVERPIEAVNVNTLDELPDSSWFTNRVGLRPMTPEQVAVGPCQTPPLDPTASLTIVSSKPDGVTPGFVIRAADGRRYLVKFDDGDQGPRATAADAIVSRLYYAAGYTTPCNRVVFFDRSRLAVAPSARETDWLGNVRPYSESDLDASLRGVARTRDGRLRALVSEWLEGKPLGPWRFEGRRADDPNDIVDHEDRRELRGLRLLAAWTGHGDEREQNTLAMWLDADPGQGWIRHDFVDFGDCLGNLARPPMLARRLAGHAYGVDFGQVTADLLTFGLIQRPFEAERFGPSGAVFAYFNAVRFDPEHWRPSYPNPAFSRMTERDGAWMARILAHLTAEHVERAIRAGRLGAPALRDELQRVLLGRRARILERYLPRFSSLSLPAVTTLAGRVSLCADDLAVLAGIADAAKTTYEATLHPESGLAAPLVTRVTKARACIDLPAAASNANSIRISWRARGANRALEGRLELRLEHGPKGDTLVALQRFEPSGEP